MSSININLHNGDCLEIMKGIADKSVDMILCDLPYGTTACKWDTIIPFEPLWEQYKRVIKDNGAIVLFGSQPFTTKLISSNMELFKYEIVWEKTLCSNFMHAPNMPLKTHENILVFSSGKIGHLCQLGNNRMEYNPQGITEGKRKNKSDGNKNSEHKLYRESHPKEYILKNENYPKSVLKYQNSSNKERGLHPTQKPTALLEYLIHTYTNESETILDNCMGSGSTGVACVNTNRNFIGIELDETYFNIAQKRITEATHD